MANYSNYRFPIPEANQLASLTGIEQDISGVISYCDFLQGNSKIANFNHTIWVAVSVAAVVRYARCFSSGVRDSLPHDFVDSSEELRQDHKYFIDLRSKHFAHSVNPFEENEVTIQIGDHFTSSQEITAIHSFNKHVVGLALTEPALLKRLAEAVLKKVKEIIKQEKMRLLSRVKEHNLEELKSYGIPSLEMDSDRASVGRSRPRGEKA